MYFIDAQSLVFGHQNSLVKWLDARFMSDASFELNMEIDVARFSLGKQVEKRVSPTHGKKTPKRVKM